MNDPVPKAPYYELTGLGAIQQVIDISGGHKTAGMLCPLHLNPADYRHAVLVLFGVFVNPPGLRAPKNNWLGKGFLISGAAHGFFFFHAVPKKPISPLWGPGPTVPPQRNVGPTAHDRPPSFVSPPFCPKAQSQTVGGGVRVRAGPTRTKKLAGRNPRPKRGPRPWPFSPAPCKPPGGSVSLLWRKKIPPIPAPPPFGGLGGCRVGCGS